MLLGTALIARWFLYYLLSDTYSSRLPSLFLGLGMILVAMNLGAVAFIADLIAANRRIVSEVSRTQREYLLNREKRI